MIGPPPDRSGAHHLVQMGQHVPALARVAAPVTSAPTASFRSSPSSARASAGRNGSRPGFSSTPLPNGVHHGDGAPPAGLGEPDHAELRVGPQVQRVGPGGVDPAQHHVDRLVPAQRPHPQPAPRTVRSALSTSGRPSRGQEAWSKAVSECVPGAQHHDPRVLGVASARPTAAPSARCGRTPVRPRGRGAPEQLGQHPRHHPAVGHRVAGPGRRLGAVAERLELAVGVHGTRRAAWKNSWCAPGMVMPCAGRR